MGADGGARVWSRGGCPGSRMNESDGNVVQIGQADNDDAAAEC